MTRIEAAFGLVEADFAIVPQISPNSGFGPETVQVGEIRLRQKDASVAAQF
ncbi:MAG: hypothetical protein ACREBG_31235 [Pyrinomonadaceae bacterium]